MSNAIFALCFRLFSADGVIGEKSFDMHNNPLNLFAFMNARNEEKKEKSFINI